MIGNDDLRARSFADAVVRLQVWITAGDYRMPTPFADALDSLYALREEQRRRLAKAHHRTAYFDEVNRHPDGAVLEAIIFARGLVVHVGANAAIVGGARPFRVGRSTVGGRDRLRGSGVTVVWRPLAELPPGDRPETHGRDLMYNGRVAGRDVLETLAEARNALTDIAAVA